MKNRFTQPTPMDKIIKNTTKEIQQLQSSTGASPKNQNPILGIMSKEMQSMFSQVQSELIPTLSVYCKDFTGKYGKQVGILEGISMEYTNQLFKAGITAQRLKVGIQRLKERSATEPWTPTPAEIVRLCMPTGDEIGLKSINDTIIEISHARRTGRNGEQGFAFSHPIVEILNEQIGYQINMKSLDEFTKLIKPIYDRLVKQALKGELPAPAPALDYKPESPEPEHIKQYALDPESDLGKRIAVMKNNAKTKKENIHLKTDRTVLKTHQRPVNTKE